MNLFVPYADARWSAQALDDKRVNKMILETAQMLSTVVGGPYKAAHKNHPCTVWVGETNKNYEWALTLFTALCDEYLYRFGKEHKCNDHAMVFVKARGRIPAGPRTPFPDCSGYDGDGGQKDIHINYRACLEDKWADDKRAPKWTRRGAPDWSTFSETL